MEISAKDIVELLTSTSNDVTNIQQIEEVSTTNNNFNEEACATIISTPPLNSLCQMNDVSCVFLADSYYYFYLYFNKYMFFF